jgi:LacI family transcriptional regulator, gluconate utilization system Gnt-I transcriptional repressor
MSSRGGRRSSARGVAKADRPTIGDVSQLAGVSRMTVSRVLRTPNAVLADTRARVTKAIARLGYVPDRAAGSLSSRRTGFIALVLPTLTNSNFASVAHGLTETLRAADYDLLIAYNEYSLEEEERQLRNLLERRPEAIVLTGAVHRREAARMLLAANVPVVEIADLASRPIEHAVGFSNYEAGRAAARHLIGKGFKRIGAVGSSTDGEVVDHRGEERLRGFQDALKLAGLSTEYITRYGRAPVSYEHGASVAGVLLGRAPAVQGVFAVSDLSAVGLMMECQRRGVRIPEDLAVMGFGDFEIARVINPPLTTIHVDFRALGQRTGQLILEILSPAAAGNTPHSIDVGLKVLERTSTTVIQTPKRK